MKSIFAFFFIVFASLSAGVYFYETQIASPRAADALVKSKKKNYKKNAAVKPESIIKKPSPTVMKVADTIGFSVKSPRIIDLIDRGGRNTKELKARINKQSEIEASIKKSIKQSVGVEIQKAVVSEMSKKR